MSQPSLINNACKRIRHQDSRPESFIAAGFYWLCRLGLKPIPSMEMHGTTEVWRVLVEDSIKFGTGSTLQMALASLIVQVDA